MKRVANAVLDVVVVGGGPAGSVAAHELARHGRSVTLVERTTYAGYRVGELIASYARSLLDGLGLDEIWTAAGVQACDGIVSAWGTDELALRASIESAHGAAAIVERRRFDRELALAAERAGATLVTGARPRGVSYDGARFTLELATGPLQSRWLIDATGRRAWCNKRLGGRRVIQDRLVGVGRRFGDRGADREWKDVLLLESAPSGYWYSLPLPEGPMVTVWLSDGDLHAGSGALASAPHTASRIGDIADIAEPAVAPTSWDASSAVAWEPEGIPLITAGDAAMACDPLAADGVVRAIVSGCDAARSILEEERDAEARHGKRAAAWRAYLDERGRVYAMEERFRKEPFWRRRAAVASRAPWIDPAGVIRVDEPCAAATARAEALLGSRAARAIVDAATRTPRSAAHQVLARARARSGAARARGGAPDPAWVRALEALVEDGALLVS